MRTCSSQECKVPFSIYELGIIILPSVLVLSKFITNYFTSTHTSPSLIPPLPKYVFLGLAIYVIVYTIHQYKRSTVPAQSPCLSYCFLCKHRSTRHTLSLLLFMLFSLTISTHNIFTILTTPQNDNYILLMLNLASVIVTWSLFLRSLYL